MLHVQSRSEEGLSITGNPQRLSLVEASSWHRLSSFQLWGGNVANYTLICKAPIHKSLAKDSHMITLDFKREVKCNAQKMKARNIL